MSRKHSTAFGIGTAVAGAAVAAFIGMGTAQADDSLVPDGYQDLFGAPGTTGLALGQAADNVSLDEQAALNNLGSAGAFDAAVDRFEEAGTAHPLTQLIDALDQNAFVTQFDPDINGYLPGAIDPITGLHGYLVPDDFLGYLAVDLDAYLLNPTGLGPLLLGPLIDVLLGFPASP
jgi:hypothetical protein